ncbi:glutamate--tRNA ligase [Candidatus Microgenomates bacterium]|nr:glutamate--tRNA ligase [Candidatus Microgenomates bacterium]
MPGPIVRTRFAPSPTGELHIGGARTALYAYLFAKKNDGYFLVRIEDTDQSRLVKDSDLRILEVLEWLGLNWAEDPIYQSSRTSLYKEYARQLLEKGHAYFCFCSADRLEKLRLEQTKKKQPIGYDRFCRNLKGEEILSKLKNNEPHIIRMKIPLGEKISFDDMIRGRVEFNTNNIDDQVLIKSDGFPTYHLASVVDDYESGITHILRGEEWLSSTPKHLLLYKFFGWHPPVIAHLPNIVGKDKKKLSKREGDVSVEKFKKDGYLPEAIINFIAFLGWSPNDEREFFTLKELSREFIPEKIHKNPAILDLDKLQYINSYYIRKMNEDILIDLLRDFSKIDIDSYDKEFIGKILKVTRDRMRTLKDFDLLTNYFFASPKVKKDILKFPKSFWPETIKGISAARDNLAKAPESSWKSLGILEDILKRTVEAENLKNGDVFWPVRYALSGEEKSPSPAELLWVLGREEGLKRIKKALEKVIS